MKDRGERFQTISSEERKTQKKEGNREGFFFFLELIVEFGVGAGEEGGVDGGRAAEDVHCGGLEAVGFETADDVSSCGEAAGLQLGEDEGIVEVDFKGPGGDQLSGHVISDPDDAKGH